MFSGAHDRFTDTLSGRNRFLVLCFCCLLLTLLCWLDYATGDYSLIIFYLVPVSLAAWFVGQSAGLAFCFFSLVARLIADNASSPAASHFSKLHLWNLLVEFVFLVVMSRLLVLLRKNLVPRIEPDRSDRRHKPGA